MYLDSILHLVRFSPIYNDAHNHHRIKQSETIRLLQKQDAEASKQRRQYELLNKQKQLSSKHFLLCVILFWCAFYIDMYIAYLVFSD